MKIYDKTIELAELETGVVTDIVVLARVIQYDRTGRARDEVVVSSTDSTTRVLTQGLLNEAMLQTSAAS